MAEHNDFSWLTGIEAGDLAYQRGWKSSDGHSVVVQIAVGRRGQVFKAAKGWKGVGVVLTPYLSRATMQLRQDRTEVYRTLEAAGANPKWEGLASIKYTDEKGMRRLYVF